MKIKHGMSSRNELKWVKVSKNKLKFYDELFQYFFESDDLNARILVASGKDKLNYSVFSLTHDEWYYRMYYLLLNKLISPVGKLITYKIFLDIKDTKGGGKIETLTNVLCSKNKVDTEVIHGIKQIRSHESELLQLVDLFIIAYVTTMGT